MPSGSAITVCCTVCPRPLSNWHPSGTTCWRLPRSRSFIWTQATGAPRPTCVRCCPIAASTIIARANLPQGRTRLCTTASSPGCCRICWRRTERAQGCCAERETCRIPSSAATATLPHYARTVSKNALRCSIARCRARTSCAWRSPIWSNIPRTASARIWVSNRALAWARWAMRSSARWTRIWIPSCRA